MAKTKKQTVECSECGASIVRNVPLSHKRNFFCNNACKGEFQKRARLLSKDDLYEMYVVRGMDCRQIGDKIGRDPKSVWNWITDFGIPTRPRGSNERQQFGKGKDIPSGWSHSDETKEKLRQARINDGAACLFRPNGDHVLKGRTGPNHPSWKGGSTPERQAFYSSQEWKSACVSVWSRSNAICERCGLDHRSVDRDLIKFHVHHVYSFTTYPEHRSDIDNLMLLCQDCHRWVHSRDNVNKDYIKEKPSDETT